MSVVIPASHVDLLEGPNYATVATVLPGGQPQLSVVWCDYDGTHVLVNSTRGRLKDKNMTARPQATVLIIDPQNSFRYLEVRATVEEITEEGAFDHINKMAKLYTGQDSYYGGVQPAEMVDQETRMLYKLKPTKVVAFSPQ